MFATQWELVPVDEANSGPTFYRNIGSWGDDPLDSGPVNLAEVSEAHFSYDSVGGITRAEAKVIFDDGQERTLLGNGVFDLHHELRLRVAETRSELDADCQRMWGPAELVGFCAERIEPELSATWLVTASIPGHGDPGYDPDQHPLWLKMLVTGFVVRYGNELVGLRHQVSDSSGRTDPSSPRRVYQCDRDDSVLGRLSFLRRKSRGT